MNPLLSNRQVLRLWKVPGGSSAERPERAGRVKALLEELRGRIPGVLHIEVGIDYGHFEQSCDAVLDSEFESKETLNAYVTYPEHFRVRDLLLGVRISRHLQVPAAYIQAGQRRSKVGQPFGDYMAYALYCLQWPSMRSVCDCTKPSCSSVAFRYAQRQYRQGAGSFAAMALDGGNMCCRRHISR
ncbi:MULTISPECIES: Dabb family protein [unclassified Pseudomonas]